MAAGWTKLTTGGTIGGTGNAYLDSGLFAEHRHLRIQLQLQPANDATVTLIAFGHGSGGTMDTTEGNYLTLKRTDSGSQSSYGDNPFDWGGYLAQGGGDSSGGALMQIDITNLSGVPKLLVGMVQMSDDGGGNRPIVTEFIGQWNNTNQIRKIQLWTGDDSDAWSSGTKIIVWGATETSYTYPNLPNGAIFEESDTGKHYMFDGTSAWNEMT